MTRARILADYVAGGTTAAEFDYLDGVTSNVQTQMDAKAPLASPTFTGTANLSSGVTLPAGHIIQVVEGPIVTDGLYNTESWGEHNSGSRVSITPSATSSKIYIIGVMTCYIQGGGNKTDFRRDIDGTVEMPLFNSSYGRYMGSSSASIANHGSWNIWGIDSPNTTSEITYSWASISTTSPYNSYTHKNSQITLMEIKG